MVATTDPRPTAARGHVRARLPTPDEAASAVARLFPRVYRRYPSARSVAGGGELPMTRRGMEVPIHLATAGPLTIGEQAAHLGLRRNTTAELVAQVGQVLAPDLLAQVMTSLDPEDRAAVVRGFELLARAEPPDPETERAISATVVDRARSTRSDPAAGAKGERS